MRRLLVVFLLSTLGWAVAPTAAQPAPFACRTGVQVVWQPYNGQIVLRDTVTGEQQVVVTGLPDASALVVDRLTARPTCTYVTAYLSTDGGATFAFTAWDAARTSDTPVFTVAPVSPRRWWWSPDGRYVLLRRSLVEDVLVEAPSGRVLATFASVNPPRQVGWAQAAGRVIISRAQDERRLEAWAFDGTLAASLEVLPKQVYDFSVSPAGTYVSVYNDFDNPVYAAATLTRVGAFPDAERWRWVADTVLLGYSDGIGYDIAADRLFYRPEQVANFDPARYERAATHPYTLIPDTSYELYVGNLDSGDVRQMNVFAPLLEPALRLSYRDAGLPYVSAACRNFGSPTYAFDGAANRLLVAASAFCGRAIAEFDIASGEPVFLYTPPSIPPGAGARLFLRLSPDGRWLAAYAVAGDSITTLWFVPRGTNDWREVEIVNTANAFLGGDAFAFSPDGTRFARGPETILVYELATGAVVGRIERSAAPVSSMRFVDNTTIETVNRNDGTATRWDVATGARR